MGSDVALAQHAEVIRALGKRVVHDVIEIGRRLTDAKARGGHGNWLPWLKREFGWSDSTALRYMQAHQFATDKSVTVTDLSLKSLYLLAAPSTPEAARDEVIERSEAGEHLTPAQIKETIAKAVNAEIEAKLQTVRAEADEREAASRLGIRGFNPKLKKAPERLKDLRMPEDQPIPPNTLAELRRDMERRRLVSDQIRQIEDARLERIEHAPSDGPHAMVRLLARVIGVGIETADMLVQEVLSRNMRDRRAVARYAGLTGSPDESGTKRREKGLARSGNARVRRGMIQLAWRFLMFQKGSALAQWFRARTENARGTRKTMIVALAHKLLIALWRLVREGVVPDGIVLRPAQ